MDRGGPHALWGPPVTETAIMHGGCQLLLESCSLKSLQSLQWRSGSGGSAQTQKQLLSADGVFLPSVRSFILLMWR